MPGIIINISEAAKLSGYNIYEEAITMILEDQTESWEKKSVLPYIYNMRSIDKYQENFRSSTAMDGFKPTEDNQAPDLADFEEGYRKTLETQIWTSSFAITKQVIEDSLDYDVNSVSSKFITSYWRTRERFGLGMLGGALTGSFTYEGKAFDCKGMDTTDGSITGSKQIYFYNAHQPATDKGVVQSNKFRSSVDLTATTAPEKMMSVLGQVENYMAKYRDEKGNILDNGRPNIILIPAVYGLKDAIITGLKSRYDSTMGTNGVNLQYGKWEVVECPMLEDVEGFAESDAAFVVINSEVNKMDFGATWLDRIPLTVRSYIVDETEANVWSGRARFGAGFGNFRAMAYVSVATTETLAATAAAQHATAITA